jgi:hypothetical protein
MTALPRYTVARRSQRAREEIVRDERWLGGTFFDGLLAANPPGDPSSCGVLQIRHDGQITRDAVKPRD